MARTVEIPIKLEFGNASLVQPGDKLVLCYQQTVSEDKAATIKERVSEKLPGVEIVIIDGVTHMIAYRRDADTIERWKMYHRHGVATDDEFTEHASRLGMTADEIHTVLASRE